jgi:hypothetical protein
LASVLVLPRTLGWFLVPSLLVPSEIEPTQHLLTFPRDGAVATIATTFLRL